MHGLLTRLLHGRTKSAVSCPCTQFKVRRVFTNRLTGKLPGRQLASSRDHCLLCLLAACCRFEFEFVSHVFVCVVFLHPTVLTRMVEKKALCVQLESSTDSPTLEKCMQINWKKRASPDWDFTCSSLISSSHTLPKASHQIMPKLMPASPLAVALSLHSLCLLSLNCPDNPPSKHVSVDC